MYLRVSESKITIVIIVQYGVDGKIVKSAKNTLLSYAKYSCKEAICKELVIFKTSGEEISHKSYNFIIEILGIAFLNRRVILIYDNYGVCPVVLIEHSGEVLKGG